MSIFASQTQITIPVPFDAPHTVTIRKLTGREVEQAQADDAFGLAAGGPRTWAARLQRMKATGDVKAMEQALGDPLVGYDRFSVIRAGLVAWSYPQPVKPATPASNGKATPVAVDAIADLDDEAADFIALEILKLTKPALFLTPAQQETAAKNG